MNDQLSKQEEISDALISLGQTRNAAIVLAHMQDKKESVSGDIEKATNMRQPEVSITTKRLKERGWITERDLKKPGKGRPCKIYSLAIEFKEIIAQLEEQQVKAAGNAEEQIKRLKATKTK